MKLSDRVEEREKGKVVMKNVAIIITKLNGGGAERCASNLSIELSKKYNVKLIVFDPSNQTYPHGGELISLDVPPGKGPFRKVWNVFKRVRMVKAIKKKHKIDCAISLMDGPNLVNVLSSRGEKTVVSIRIMLSQAPMNRVRKALIRYASLHSDRTVSLSEMVKLDLVKEFNIPEGKITTVYNHCDAELLRSLVTESAFDGIVSPEHVNFVTMGRLNPQKGQWHLIRAFQRVVREIPNAHLIILGKGELEGRLRALIKDLGLSEHVFMPGYIPNPHGVYRHCEAFVFPSLYEGLGNVLLEALAFDMPIISADCEAGPREILAPETSLESKAREMELAKYGVLVPVPDGGHFNAEDPLTREEEILADAMIYLHKNPEVREAYRNKAAERMRRFDKDRITAEWMQVIENTEGEKKERAEC